MCGRFAVKATWAELVALYRLTMDAPPHNLRPRYNVCPTDPVDVVRAEEGKRELGSGPVIGRGSNLNPALFELLYDTGEAEKIPFTVEASARHTGTDADAVHLSRGGVPTGLVSIPVRYMHSPVELVELDDVQAAARLVAAFALRRKPGTSFAR